MTYEDSRMDIKECQDAIKHWVRRLKQDKKVMTPAQVRYAEHMLEEAYEILGRLQKESGEGR